MHETDKRHRPGSDASLDFLIELASVLDHIGQPGFYFRLSSALTRFLDSKRFLAIRYAQYAKPKFFVNEAMSETAVASYLQSYYRIDPLLRMVRDESTRPVVTFDELRRNGPDTLFYDEMYRTAEILDELVVLLPTVGGVFTAICVDRSRRCFSEAEVLRARLIYPTLRRIHDLHTRQSLYSHFGGAPGTSEIATMIIDAGNNIVFRSADWLSKVASNFEQKLSGMVRRSQRGLERVESNLVLHWESLDTANAVAPGGKVVMLEGLSPGYLDLTSEDLIRRFSVQYDLTPREVEIVTHTLGGQSTARISDILNISVGTVRNHKHRLYYKLDITTERELFSMMFDSIVHS